VLNPTDMLITKRDRLFACSSRSGDVIAGTPLGLFLDDARYLSLFVLRIDGRPPLVLASEDDGTRATVRGAQGRAGSAAPLELGFRRDRTIADNSMRERIALTNYGSESRTVVVSLEAAADFTDLFELRGVVAPTEHEPLESDAVEGTARFRRRGPDGVVRSTEIRARPAPRTLILEEVARLEWTLQLEPRQTSELGVEVVAHSPLERAATAREWPLAGVDCSDPHITGWFQRSGRDLAALLTTTSTGPMVAAGIPWYVAPFGRDGLISAFALAPAAPLICLETLRTLAADQATADDPAHDAEPGKIPHEVRSGPLARAGKIPFSPYYGTADATPLFLMVAGEYLSWTGRAHELSGLLPHLDAAARWIDEWGDRDGDGFVEYERRARGGLDNQGWKDSGDAIVDSEGKRAGGPIALAEVQAYAYAARLALADIHSRIGNSARAESLRSAAHDLRRAFNDAFWCEQQQTFALALDGDKRPLASVTTNAGHALLTGIADEDKANALASRLLAPDVFTGWGLRTLASSSPAYNPMSYHRGSVWPHDTALVAVGLRRYGFVEEAVRVCEALIAASRCDPDARLPELFCGFDRDAGATLVEYPGSCRPQAWSAAVPWLVLRALLGLSARGERLIVEDARLPSDVGSLELHGVQVGPTRVDLVVVRDGSRIEAEVMAGGDVVELGR
jgi:glycogen debranching enzyme